MSWFVYIARCMDSSLYTGITTDLDERFRRHNTGRGSTYVRSKRRAVLVYSESYTDKTIALRREHEIKSWNRKKKLWLIGQPVKHAPHG